MKKELTIAAITFIFAATPVFAHSGDNQGNDFKHFEGKHIDNDDDQGNLAPTKLPTTKPYTTFCDPSFNWKNHGAYVSCVAHLHHIDKDNDTDDAARSNVSKQHYPTGTPVPTISPTISPTIFATPTPGETVIPTPSGSVTPTGTTSPTPTDSPIPSTSPIPTANVSPTPDNTDVDVPQPSFTNIDNAIVRIISFFSHLL